MKPAFTSRSRLPALLAVLLVHLAVGTLMLGEARRLPGQEKAQRTELRLIVPRPPQLKPAAVRPPAPTGLPPRPAALPRASNAITLPALPQAAAEAPVVTPPAPASSPAPLDLRLPGRLGTARSGGIADQIRADGRANSPRETLEQRLAASMGAAMGNGEIEVIEGVQGGRMIRGPNGECTLIRPTMMEGIDPGNERWRHMPGKASDCSKLQPGARRHERPK